MGLYHFLTPETAFLIWSVVFPSVKHAPLIFTRYFEVTANSSSCLLCPNNARWQLIWCCLSCLTHDRFVVVASGCILFWKVICISAVSIFLIQAVNVQLQNQFWFEEWMKWLYTRKRGQSENICYSAAFPLTFIMFQRHGVIAFFQPVIFLSFKKKKCDPVPKAWQTALESSC